MSPRAASKLALLANAYGAGKAWGAEQVTEGRLPPRAGAEAEGRVIRVPRGAG